MSMRRIVLTTVVMAGLATMTVSAVVQAQGGRGQAGGRGGGGAFGTPSVDGLQVEKLTDTLFVLSGGGGNTAAFITAGGVVLVDTKVAGWGQPIIEKLKTLTSRPVTTIINTHAHFDHVDGNVEFPPTVDIVTHANTKTYMEQRNPVYGLNMDTGPNPFKDSNGRGMPKRTFTETMTLGSGAEAIEPWSHQRLEAAVRAYAEEADVKLGKVAQPLRAALTGKATSPGIFDVLDVLGREEAIARIRDQASSTNSA
jgi:hypothetical protein